MSKNSEGLLFQNDAIRDVKMIKAFISFVNRVKNPNMTLYFWILGLAAMAMPLATDQPIVSKIAFCLGVILILFGCFREYIPLALTIRSDKDYNEKALISCCFYRTSLKVLRNGELFIDVPTYKQLTGLYEDETYFYVSINNDDLLVLPKWAFVSGTAEEFKDFFVNGKGQTFIWVPAGFINKMKALPAKIRTNMAYNHAEQERKQAEIRMREEQRKANKRNKRNKKNS